VIAKKRTRRRRDDKVANATNPIPGCIPLGAIISAIQRGYDARLVHG